MTSTSTPTVNGGVFAPTVPDFTELLCDMAGYATVRAIRGDFLTAKSVRKDATYFVSILIYNLAIRKAIMPDIIGNRDSVNTLVEVFTLGTLFAFVEVAMGNRKIPNFANNYLDALGAKALSEQYLEIKAEFLPRGMVAR